jgi:hypothetical protein
MQISEEDLKLGYDRFHPHPLIFHGLSISIIKTERYTWAYMFLLVPTAAVIRNWLLMTQSEKKKLPSEDCRSEIMALHFA